MTFNNLLFTYGVVPSEMLLRSNIKAFAFGILMSHSVKNFFIYSIIYLHESRYIE